MAAGKDVIIDVALVDDLSVRDLISGKAAHAYPLDITGFVEYARRMHCLETIEFLQDVDSLAKRTGDPFDLIQEVEHIAEAYVVSGSPREINIPGTMRTETLERVRDLKSAMVTMSWKGLVRQAPAGGDPAQVFDECVQEVELMLRKDVFPRFVNDCIHRQHLAISREMCYWWRRRPVHLLGFPNPVNELEARLHSACVTALTVAHIVLLYEYDVSALGWFILYGFTARVVSGPRFDPQAYLVVLVLRPLLEDVLQVAKSSFKPSPPKRFAQFVGVLFALTATVIDHGFGLTFVSAIVWGCLAAAAAVLALFGFCAACYVFSLAVQAGIVPPAYCESCAYSYTTKKARPKPTATKVVCKRVTSPRTQTETP